MSVTSDGGGGYGGGGGFGGGGGGGSFHASFDPYQTTAQLRASGSLLGSPRGATPSPANAAFGNAGGFYGLQTVPTEQQNQNAAMMAQKTSASDANVGNPDFQLHSWGNDPGIGEVSPGAHSWDRAPGFAAGTIDSGAKDVFANLGEQGREAVIPPNGAGYMVGEDGPTQGVLPAHSTVVPNDVVEGEFADEVIPSGIAAQYMGPKPSSYGVNRMHGEGALAAQQNAAAAGAQANPGPGQGMVIGGKVVPKPEFNAAQDIPWPAADRSAAGIYGVNPMTSTPPPMVPGYAGMKGQPTSRQADIPQMMDNILKGGSTAQKLGALQILQHGTMQANSQDFERNRMQEQRDIYAQDVKDVNTWRRNDAEQKRQQGIASHVGTSKYLEGAGILPKGTSDFINEMHDPAEASAFVKAAQTGYKAMNSDRQKYDGFMGALDILSKQKDSGVTPEMLDQIREHSKEPIEGTDQFKYNPGVAEKLFNHVSKQKKEQVAKFQEIKDGLGVIMGPNGQNIPPANLMRDSGSAGMTQAFPRATAKPHASPYSPIQAHASLLAEEKWMDEHKNAEPDALKKHQDRLDYFQKIAFPNHTPSQVGHHPVPATVAPKAKNNAALDAIRFGEGDTMRDAGKRQQNLESLIKGK